jgi:hypothetical protein
VATVAAVDVGPTDAPLLLPEDLAETETEMRAPETVSER